MHAQLAYPKAHLRELASLVSHAAFKKLSASTNQSAYIRRMKKYCGWQEMVDTRPRTLGDLIAHSYSLLEGHYRHEYLYKNKLLNDYVLKEYSLDDTILLNEFRIGQSIADAVLVNGTNKVFEIKTELDTPERLHTQLVDYYKAFTEVYLFTHHSLADRYLHLLPFQVGLLVYDGTGAVTELRRATYHDADLDVVYMMASLRKAEYTRLVRDLLGFVPEATAAFFYRTCLEALLEVPVVDVQRGYCHILKQRIDAQTNTYVAEQAVPTYLNFSFYQQKYSKSSYLRLINNLSKNV